ncbi:MAG: PEP-CTERM sorting domain-containing protein [Verrucomicrobiota bacterium]
MMNNEAKTRMPWTAMGYTYNWNYLEDGQNGRADDPFRVGSYVGATEFVVSAGATVVFDHFVENTNLYSYLIPEPNSVILFLFGAGVVYFVILHRARLKVIRANSETRGPGQG